MDFWRGFGGVPLSLKTNSLQLKMGALGNSEIPIGKLPTFRGEKPLVLGSVLT